MIALTPTPPAVGSTGLLCSDPNPREQTVPLWARSAVPAWEGQQYLSPGRNIVWFSCGAASAVAARMAVEKYGAENIHVVYCDTSKDENADNPRFMADVEKWIGVKIETIRSEKYQSVEDVFEARQYMSGPSGAPCTVEMKKVPRFQYQWGGDVHIFGLTADETMPLCRNPQRDRIKRFSHDNHDLRLDWILADNGITKADTLRIVEEAGIALPIHYSLGFANNNCWGCVKATSPKYWNLVRKHNTEVFARRCEQSRRIGCKLVRLKGERIFLDELPPDEEEDIKEDLSCGPQCAPSNKETPVAGLGGSAERRAVDAGVGGAIKHNAPIPDGSVDILPSLIKITTGDRLSRKWSDFSQSSPWMEIQPPPKIRHSTPSNSSTSRS